jgi:hypothetical protein
MEIEEKCIVLISVLSSWEEKAEVTGYQKN